MLAKQGRWSPTLDCFLLSLPLRVVTVNRGLSPPTSCPEMIAKNRFGLSRTIPNDVKREVRVRSSFGCVMCRCGIYQYEHIDPEFRDAKTHDPAHICCLCGRCHDKVTRGQLSKAAVAAQYEWTQRASDVKPPREFFDFHTGEAKLSFGSLTCDLSPTTVFQYHEQTVLSLIPGGKGSPGAITAMFCDDSGEQIFEIIVNEWIGPTSYFDLEIVGQRFTVRLPDGRVSLRLRHDAPGTVVIERMDMRFGDVHVLASEHDFAIGRYSGHGSNLVWMHVKARIDDLHLPGAAIKITQPFVSPKIPIPISAEKPGLIFNQHGRRERAFTTDQALLSNIDPLSCGIHWPAMGMQIAEGCGFAFSAFSCGVCTIDHARRHFFTRNRVNVPTMFLPAVLNSESIQREVKRSHGQGGDPKKKFPEPFLVRRDTKGIREWKRRQKSRTAKGNRQTLIADDEPGLSAAYGAIKLVDTYDGPAVRVKREADGA